MFVHVHGDPYALVSPIRDIIRGMSADQPVEHAATLEDIRAEVLTPDRLNTLVFGVFAGLALAIALVGVAGVLAFSVSGRMKEFGIRLAIGSEPPRLVAHVLGQGVAMALSGIAAGAAGGFALASLATGYVNVVRMPGVIAGSRFGGAVDRCSRRCVGPAGAAGRPRRCHSDTEVGIGVRRSGPPGPGAPMRWFSARQSTPPIR